MCYVILYAIYLMVLVLVSCWPVKTDFIVRCIQNLLCHTSPPVYKYSTSTWYWNLVDMYLSLVCRVVIVILQ